MADNQNGIGSGGDGGDYFANLPPEVLAKLQKDAPYQSSGGGAPDYTAQAAKLYQDNMGRAGDQDGINYWAQQLANGTSPDQVSQAFKNSANTVYNQYAANPTGYDQTNPGASANFANDQGARQAQTNGTNLFNFGNVPNFANGIPNYMGLAQRQSDYNVNNARMQSNMNNPNFNGPGGSQTRTMNPDGTYSVNQTLSPQLQQNYDAYNQLQGGLYGKAQSLANGPNLNYNGAPNSPTFNNSGVPSLNKFDTSGVSAIPTADQNTLNSARDALYSQQTQYLDPQFKQGQSDLESQLANQGFMPGSEGYDRAINNFNLQKQKAYGDARNSSIAAGGQEQSRLFGLGLQANQAGQANALNDFNTGLQAHTTGTNDALAGFNTGLQSRQQGVSEANALHNAPLNDLASLRGMQGVSMPTYQGQVGTNIPGVDYTNAANQGFNASIGLQNAQSASQNNFNQGLFNLGSSAIQNPGAISGAWNWATGSNGSSPISNVPQAASQASGNLFNGGLNDSGTTNFNWLSN